MCVCVSESVCVCVEGEERGIFHNLAVLCHKHASFSVEVTHK